jgi:hypothetical protein
MIEILKDFKTGIKRDRGAVGTSDEVRRKLNGGPDGTVRDRAGIVAVVVEQ